MLLSITPMHIPDGFLSIAVSISFWVASSVVIGYALRRVGADLGERQIPLMGVLAAAIFAGQMLNFAIGGGTSGHLMGAALACILLGPWAAILVMTCVVAVQALIFQGKKDINQALAILEKAFSLAQPEGYARIFLDEGKAMEVLIQACSRSVEGPLKNPRLNLLFLAH